MRNPSQDILKTPLEYIGLPLRASNILRRHQIATVGEMVKHRREELLHLPGFGKACMAAVERFLEKYGLLLS